MAYFEIRGGLKRLEFERSSVSSDEATCAVVEFVYEVPLATGQWARITLGRHNGVVRQLVGVPELVSIPDTKARKPEYLYRLRGTITEARD
jgi:hypothetical protein